MWEITQGKFWEEIDFVADHLKRSHFGARYFVNGNAGVGNFDLNRFFELFS